MGTPPRGDRRLGADLLVHETLAVQVARRVAEEFGQNTAPWRWLSPESNGRDGSRWTPKVDPRNLGSNSTLS